MIRFSDVTYSYPGQDTPAIDGIDLGVESGEFVVLLGANGSGKSTLALMANGLIIPTTGFVEVDGERTHDPENAWRIRGRVGTVFQNPDNQIVGTVVEEDVAFGPENLGVCREELGKRVADSISAVGLDGLERREPHLLSGGQKQRLAIAGALAMQPDYLVLDEPTAMLDPEGREAVGDLVRDLRAEERGVLLITHDLSDVADADKVVVLESGRVVFEGKPDDLLSTPERLDGWGLSLPPVMRLAGALADLGAPVQRSAPDAESVVGAFWG